MIFHSKTKIIVSYFLELQDHIYRFFKYDANFVNSAYLNQIMQVNDKKH